MTTPDRLEIRPRALRTALIAGPLCLGFVALGVYLIATGGVLNILIGLISIAYFGALGLIGVPARLRQRVSLVLTPDGLEHHVPRGSAFLPWADVEAVGEFHVSSTRHVGLRLRSYDHYLATATPDLAAFVARMLRLNRFVLIATSAVSPWNLWRCRPPRPDAETDAWLRDLGPRRPVAEMLLWNRHLYKYDLVFSWADLDRPTHEFLALLKSYLDDPEQVAEPPDDAADRSPPHPWPHPTS